MKEIILVKPEHVELGKQKYQAKRDENLENLLKNGDMECEVFRFIDGRILTVYTTQGFGLLYINEEVLFNKIVL